MRKKTIALILAALLSLTTLVGAKIKKNSDELFFESLEEYDDLKKSVLNYQKKNILSEMSKVFEHRCSSKINTKNLFELLEMDLTKKEEEIIEKFITDNSIINNEADIKIPENTSVGYIISNRINKCSVEVDIQFTKDNVPVLFHDENLSEATNGIITKKINDFTYAEISKIKVFYNQKNYSYIPTLEEILELHSIDDYYSILLEIKPRVIRDLLDSYKKTYTALNNILSEIEDVERTYLMSGDQLFILNNYEKFKDLGIKTGITIYNSAFLRDFAIYFDKEHYDFISFNIEVLSRDLIEVAVKNKKALFIGSSSKANIEKIVKLYKYLNIYENFFILTDHPEKYSDLMLEMEKQKQLIR